MKLKHRITGTILMIAFATTTALPAATIPNLKSPPKAVTAPRVPAAIAPRVPVVPKVNVPSVPKVPAVKVPTVKIPVTPRIVSAPRIPVVKAAPKIPATPKVVTAPKAVKIPVAIKTKTPVVAAQPARSPKLNPKDAPKVVDEAFNAPRIDRMPDFAGGPGKPARALPGANKPSLKPTEAQPSLDGDTGTPTPTVRKSGPTLTVKEGKAAFDNGFGSRPQVSEADLGNVLTLNPMKGDQGGPASSGPLGDSASNGNPSKGPAGQGKGLVSDGAADGASEEPMPQGDADLKDESMPAGDADTEDETMPAGDGDVELLHEGTDKDGNKVEVSAEGEIVTTRPDGSSTSVGPDGSRRSLSAPNKQGESRNEVYEDPNGNKTVKVDGKEVGTIDKDGNITPTSSAGTPDPENRGKGKHTFGVAVGQQLKQSKSGRKGSLGGGADVMPGNESPMDGARRIPGAAVPQNSKNNLVGNPGQQGGPENGGTTPPANPNDPRNETNPTPIDN